MKTLSAAAETAITGAVRAHQLLVEIGFTTPLRFTTGAALTWDSKSFLSRPFSVSQLTTATGGVASVRLTLANRDNALTSQFLSVSPRDKDVTIWALYGEGPWDPEDGIELFAGKLDAVLEIADDITIEAAARRTGATKTPNLTVQMLCGGRLPAAGDSFNWGGGLMTWFTWDIKAQQ